MRCNRLSFLMILFLFSCSQLEKKEERRTPAGVQPQFPEEVNLQGEMDIPDEKVQLAGELKGLVEKAQKAGPKEVQFLSSDLSLKAHDSALRGDSHLAVQLYEAVSELNPNDIYIQRKHAVELIKIGKLQRAEKILAKLIDHTDEKDKEVMGLVLAGVYTALGKSDEAVKTYQKVLKQNPKSEEACVFLAKAYIAKENDSKAFSLLDRCQSKRPESAVFSYYKGKVHLERGEEKQATKSFRSALKRNATYHQAAIAIGALHEQAEEYEKAIAHYKDYLKKDEMSYPVLGRLVQLLFSQAHYDEIIPYAEKLSSLDPRDINLKVRLGILYTDAKRYEDAKGIFKEVLVAVPESDRVLFYLGSLYQETQKYELAIEYFSRISEKSPLFHDGHLQIAHMLHAMAGESEAKEREFVSFVESTIEEHSEIAFELKVILTSFYESKENFTQAIRTLKSVSENDSFSEGHRYYLAALYDKQGQYDQALDHIKQILEANPDHAHALNFLGYTMIEKGEDLAQAYDYIKKAVSLMPEDGYIRDSLGWYYYKVGNYEKALSETKKAWESVKTDVMVTKHLGLIYQKLEQYDQAEKYLREALRYSQAQNEKEAVEKALEKLQKEVQGKRLPASD